jgi:hypothetical protein
MTSKDDMKGLVSLKCGTVGYLEELNIFIIVLQDIAGQCKTVKDSAGECWKGWEV